MSVPQTLCAACAPERGHRGRRTLVELREAGLQATIPFKPRKTFSRLVVLLAVFHLVSVSPATEVIVEKLDGKTFAGALAFAAGALTITSTNGSVETIPLASLALLKARPLLEFSGATAKGSGNGLFGSYYNSREFLGRSIPRVDERVDFNWGQAAPMPAINRDYFGVRWTGEVEAPVSGEFTFYLQADDGGRLWLDKKLLIDQTNPPGQTEGAGKIQLEAAKRYEIRVDYFDGLGEASVRLLWSGPDLEKSVVPKERLYARSTPALSTPSDHGVLGVYFSHADLTGQSLARLDPTINFDWGESRPIQGLGEQTFSVRWLGQVQPQFDEHYTFHLEAEGRARLWVDNRLVIDQWKEEASTAASVPAQLRVNTRYELRMELAKTGSRAGARLLWSSPSTPRTVVPQEALFPADANRVLASATDALTGRRAGLPKGVLLTSGSLIAAPIVADDESKVMFRVNGGEFVVSMINVAAIIFQDVAPEWANRFQGRRGALFANRDFVDGEFKSLQRGQLRLSSVLFGLQTYDIGSRVSAVFLRDPVPRAWQYQVKTADGSDLFVSGMTLEPKGVVISDAALRGFTVPPDQLLQIRRSTN